MTYIGSTPHEDLLPNSKDTCTLVDVKWSDKLHPCHKIFGSGKDQYIDVVHKLDYQGIAHQNRIHPF